MAEGEKLPPAPPSDQDQLATSCPSVSIAVALREVEPPEATIDGDADAVTENSCAAAFTVRAIEALPPIGVGPAQVAVTVSVTARSAPVSFSAAV